MDHQIVASSERSRASSAWPLKPASEVTRCESGVVCGRPNLPGIVTIERSADMEGVVPELTRTRVLAAPAAGTETDHVQ